MNEENVLFLVLQVLQQNKRNMPVREKLRHQLQFSPISKILRNASIIHRNDLKSTEGKRLTNNQAKRVKRLAYKNVFNNTQQGLKNNRRNIITENVPIGIILGANGNPLTQNQINTIKRKEENKLNILKRLMVNWRLNKVSSK